jgi:hypothetical protein
MDHERIYLISEEPMLIIGIVNGVVIFLTRMIAPLFFIVPDQPEESNPESSTEEMTAARKVLNSLTAFEKQQKFLQNSRTLLHAGQLGFISLADQKVLRHIQLFRNLSGRAPFVWFILPIILPQMRFVSLALSFLLRL